MTTASITTTSNSPLSMQAEKSSTRSSLIDTAHKTATAARDVLYSQVITVKNKKYLIWATSTLPDGTQQSLSAERATWKMMEEALDEVLTGTETEEVTVEVESTDQLKVNGKTTTKQTYAKVVSAFRDFEKSIVGTKPYEKPTLASAAASTSKNVNSSSRSYAQDFTNPIRAAISDLEKDNTPISGTTLLTCLESLKDRKVKIVSTQEPITNRNTTWETEITDKMRTSGYTENNLLENCKITSGESVYIPIRITGSSHYVGLFVKGNKAYYYDSKGRPYNNGKKTALEEQITKFCANNKLALPDNNSQYIVPKDPHQSSEDHVHCGIYQINWYISLNAQVDSPDAEPIDLTPELQFPVQALRQLLIEHFRNELRDSQTSSTQSSSQKSSATTKSSATAAATNSAAASTQSKPSRSSVTIEDADNSDDDELSTKPPIVQPTTVNASPATTRTTTPLSSSVSITRQTVSAPSTAASISATAATPSFQAVTTSTSAAVTTSPSTSVSAEPASAGTATITLLDDSTAVVASPSTQSVSVSQPLPSTVPQTLTLMIAPPLSETTAAVSTSSSTSIPLKPPSIQLPVSTLTSNNQNENSPNDDDANVSGSDDSNPSTPTNGNGTSATNKVFMLI